MIGSLLRTWRIRCITQNNTNPKSKKEASKEALTSTRELVSFFKEGREAQNGNWFWVVWTWGLPRDWTSAQPGAASLPAGFKKWSVPDCDQVSCTKQDVTKTFKSIWRPQVSHSSQCLRFAGWPKAPLRVPFRWRGRLGSWHVPVRNPEVLLSANQQFNYWIVSAVWKVFWMHVAQSESLVQSRAMDQPWQTVSTVGVNQIKSLVCIQYHWSLESRFDAVNPFLPLFRVPRGVAVLCRWHGSQCLSHFQSMVCICGQSINCSPTQCFLGFFVGVTNYFFP